jgi:hypothetical protein
MITYPANPVAVDAFIVEFNTKISTLLTWLNNPLGRVQPVTKEVSGILTKVPAIHEDSGEYIEVYPSDTATNFSWFVLGAYEPIGRSKFKMSAALNMFLDLRKIYPSVTTSRNLENAKIAVFDAIEAISLLSGAVRITGISEEYEDVYSGYALPASQDKYFMQPYAGLSFSLDLYIKNTARICINPVIPVRDYHISTDVPGVNIPEEFVTDGSTVIRES